MRDEIRRERGICIEWPGLIDGEVPAKLRYWLLKKIAYIAYTYPVWVLTAVILTTFPALYGAFDLDVQIEIIDLLPSDSEAVESYFDVIENFGLTDYVVLFLEGREEIDTEFLGEYINALAEGLESLDTLDFVDYRFTLRKSREIESFLLNYLTLFVEPSDLAMIVERLSKEGINTVTSKNQKLCLTGASIVMREILMIDPLWLITDFISGLENSHGFFNLEIFDEYYMSSDHHYLFMILKPNGPPQDLSFNRKLDAGIQRVIKEVNDVYAGNQLVDDVKIRYSGSHIIALEESRLIRRDIFRTTLTSFLGVLLLFYIAFKRLGVVLFGGIPLIIAVIWALGIGKLTIGHLNLITSVCSAIVMGLGIDFAIHIYNRYLDERAHGAGTLKALETALAYTGKGVTAGAFTTAIAFFAMIFTEFKGIAEFGFLTGVGILASLTSMIVILPVLVSLREKSAHKNVQFKPLRPFGAGKLSRILTKRTRPVILICCLMTLISLLLIPGVNFNDNLRAMRSRHNKALLVQDKIKEMVGSNLRPIICYVYAETENEILTKINDIVQKLEPLKQNGKISWLDSLNRYLPSLEKQNRNLQKLEQYAATLDFRQIDKWFREALADNQIRYQPQYQEYLEKIKVSFELKNTLALNTILNSPLSLILQRYIAETDDGGYAAAVYIYPKGNMHIKQEAEEMIVLINKALDGDNDSYSLTGMALLILELKNRIRKSFKMVTTWALLAVFIILMLHFRNLKLAIISLVPVFVGIIWMMGGVRLLGIELNYINIFVVGMIIGIGIDDGIHIIHRYFEGDRRSVETTLRTTGKAIIMTSLTTMVSFGSLSFADYSGLSSMGIISLLGIGFCMVTSVVFLPALLYQFSRKNGSLKNEKQIVK